MNATQTHSLDIWSCAWYNSRPENTLSVKRVKSLYKHVKDIEEMHQYPHNIPCFVFRVWVLIKTTKKKEICFWMHLQQRCNLCCDTLQPCAAFYPKATKIRSEEHKAGGRVTVWSITSALRTVEIFMMFHNQWGGTFTYSVKVRKC